MWSFSKPMNDRNWAGAGIQLPHREGSSQVDKASTSKQKKRVERERDAGSGNLTSLLQ
jgi:hypothetical protein